MLIYLISRQKLSFLLIMGITLMSTSRTYAQEGTVLGTGTGSLVGGDLTDPENDGAADTDVGYNAVFRANAEPGFGGGEFSFNVFDNILGGGNAKWCCGPGSGIPENEGLWVEAELRSPPAFLTSFTVSSANDVPTRDPIHWAVQGSNDGVNYDTIFEHDGDSLWVERLEVVQFSAGTDFDAPNTAYQIFRLATFNTESAPNGAYFQIGEIEFFGDPVDANVLDFNGDNVVDMGDFGIMAANFNQSFSSVIESTTKGDTNYDGQVDLTDFVTLHAALTQPAGAAPVPEPAGWLLFCLGLLGFTKRHRRQR